MKMTLGDFNEIFSSTWLTWVAAQRQAKGASGNNAITAGWKGTGLHPYCRDSPYWTAAISKFGKREALATCGPAADEKQLSPAPTLLTLTKKDVFNRLVMNTTNKICDNFGDSLQDLLSRR